MDTQATDARQQLQDRRQADRCGRRRSDKIACPTCGCLQSAVLPYHPTVKQQREAEGLLRRRSCANCGRTFISEDAVMTAPPCQGRAHHRPIGCKTE
jgi:hypothetical protein